MKMLEDVVMTWIVNEREFKEVSSLPAPKRYGYFIKRVVDWGELWGLWNEQGWALVGDNADRESMPVWPHETYALAYSKQSRADYQTRSIPLSEWFDHWLPTIARDNRLVAVFPTLAGKGIVVEPDRLKRDLEQELAKY
jgi:hypothetical protein